MKNYQIMVGDPAAENELETGEDTNDLVNIS